MRGRAIADSGFLIALMAELMTCNNQAMFERPPKKRSVPIVL